MGVAKVKITKTLLKQVTKWSSNGLNKGEIAALMGYTPDHFYVMMKNSEELTLAYNVGKAGETSRIHKRVNEILGAGSDRDSLTGAKLLLDERFRAKALQASRETPAAAEAADDSESVQLVMEIFSGES